MRLGAYVLGAMASVAASAIVIRHLGVVDTGRFLTVMALVVIIGSVSDLGLTTIGIREYAIRHGEEGHRFLRNLLGIRISFAVAGLMVGVAFAAAVGYTNVMVAGTVIAGAGMLLYVVQQSLTIPLQVNLRFGWVAGLQLLFQIGVAIDAAVLSIAGAELLPFFAFQIPVIVPLIVLTVAVGGRQTRVLPSRDAPEWRRMLRQILPYSVAVVLSVVYFRLVQIMVSLFSTDVQTGYSGVAVRILDALALIPFLLVSTALPILARAAQDDDRRFTYAGRRIAEAMLIAGAGLALTVVLSAQFMIDLIAGPGFEPAVEVLRILAVALLGTFMIAARGYALLSLGRMRAILVSNAVALAVVVALGVFLVHAHGATGAAVTLLAAELSLAACYELALTRDRPQLRLSPGFVISVAVAAAAGISPLLVLDLPSLVLAALGVAIYGCALLLLGAVPDDLRDALRGARISGTGAA